MKSFFNCENCGQDTLELDIFSLEDSDYVNYSADCTNCKEGGFFDLEDLVNHIKTLEKKICDLEHEYIDERDNPGYDYMEL